MYNRHDAMCVLLFLVCAISTSGAEERGTLWAETEEVGVWGDDQVQPLREFYIGSDAQAGEGDGSIGDPYNLDSAAARGFGRPGDTYWVLGGDYLPTKQGSFLMKCDGNATNPCIFRCVPGARCTLRGMIQIYANYFWLWGMEISDPNAQYSSDADTSCPIGIWGAPSMYRGCHIINNYIHDVSSDFVFRNGMCSYGDLQTTIYGNIVFGEGHNIYVQNDYEAGGYKYVVNNMFMDVRGGSDYVETPSGDSVKFFNVHAYVESATHGMGKLSGMYFENNIIKDGRFLVGSDYEPDHHHVVNRNYFSNARCQVGYSVPAQAIVSNNKLVWSPLQLEHTWGTGETQYASWQTEQTAITGNMVICPENTTDLDYAQHIRFGTDAFTGSGIQQSTSIRPDDDVDENMYSSEFSMYFSVEGDTANGGETEWKDLSESHGNGFDTNGIFTYEVAAITANVIPNDYDSSMFYIAIFRLSFSTPLVHLDLCTYMSEEPWQSYVVSHYRDLYGEETSGSTGDCSEVEINMGTSKFEAYVLKLNESSYIPHGSSSPQPSAAHPLSIPSLFLALTCYLLFLLCL